MNADASHPSAVQAQQQPAVPPFGIDYPVFYRPEVAAERLAAAIKNRNWRLVSLGLSIAILAGIYWFFRDQLGGITWPVLLISLAFPLGYLIWAIAKEVRARSDVRTVAEGLALGIGHGGVVWQDGWLAWDEVASVQAVSGRFGRGDRLRLLATQERVVEWPLDYLSALPATIDGAIKALSGGHVRVDFSRLDA